MKKLSLLLLIMTILFLPTNLSAEEYSCIDELRTGIVKDNDSWASKKIEEVKFKVKLEGIAMDFKLLGENVFSGCNDFKYDKYTDIYQCSNFALGWGEAQNIYYEIFSFSPSKLRFLWSYLPGYIVDKKGNTPMVGGGTCYPLEDYAQL
jgi:hypothetical protein|tara:strand:- start:15 stop:461 length:447 start_codon:yes stop_codon:yes gene_type:complete